MNTVKNSHMKTHIKTHVIKNTNRHFKNTIISYRKKTHENTPKNIHDNTRYIIQGKRQGSIHE